MNKTGRTIITFTKSVRNAHEELDTTSQELKNLRQMLELLTSGEDNQLQRFGVLQNCFDILSNLDSLVPNCDSNIGWALWDKNKVLTLNIQLANTRTLQLLLETSTSKAIQALCNPIHTLADSDDSRRRKEMADIMAKRRAEDLKFLDTMME